MLTPPTVGPASRRAVGLGGAVDVLRVEEVEGLRVADQAGGELAVAAELKGGTPSAVPELDGLVHGADHGTDIDPRAGVLVLVERVGGGVIAAGGLEPDADLKVALGLLGGIPEPGVEGGADVGEAARGRVAADAAVLVGGGAGVLGEGQDEGGGVTGRDLVRDAHVDEVRVVDDLRALLESVQPRRVAGLLATDEMAVGLEEAVAHEGLPGPGLEAHALVAQGMVHGAEPAAADGNAALGGGFAGGQCQGDRGCDQGRATQGFKGCFVHGTAPL